MQLHQIPVVVVETPFSIDEMDCISTRIAEFLSKEFSQAPMDAYALLGALTTVSLEVLHGIKEPNPLQRMQDLFRLIEESHKGSKELNLH